MAGWRGHSAAVRLAALPRVDPYAQRARSFVGPPKNPSPCEWSVRARAAGIWDALLGFAAMRELGSRVPIQARQWGGKVLS